VWDCAAGTGNLLVGLTNKYNLWASTLDTQDVGVMKDRIKNGANLLETHVFQFDFLNDEFDKLPKGLREIIYDSEKRKKLIIYINPPYAEVSSVGIKGKAGVNQSKIHDKYIDSLGTAGREIFTQFLARIYHEINGCKIGEFSKMKTLNGSAFENFRQFFLAKMKKCFIVPGKTFDNVTGEFPIGFKIWDTSIKEKFKKIRADIYDSTNHYLGKKLFFNVSKTNVINKWISQYKLNDKKHIGFLAGINGNDFQQNKIVYILNHREQMANPRGMEIFENNLAECAIYFAVRRCIDFKWIYDRDQFLCPNDGWEKDRTFKSDCLTFTLFNNNISSQYGENHWIPFTAQEVGAQDNFKSDFMSGYLKCKSFTKEAKDVLKSGKELWKYYHSKIAGHRNALLDASFYDIREFFQGRSAKGTMNTKSNDEQYNALIKNLRQNLSVLAVKIQPKVYEYGFLVE
jgi:hypothetical protein